MIYNSINIDTMSRIKFIFNAADLSTQRAASPAGREMLETPMIIDT